MNSNVAMNRIIAMILGFVLMVFAVPVHSYADGRIEISSAAEVGNTIFDSFEEAVRRCGEGEVIHLLADAGEYCMPAGGCFKVNTNGYNLLVTTADGRNLMEIRNQDGTTSYHDCLVEYYWSEDGHSCTAEAICTGNDSHIFTELAETTGVQKTAPTYSEKGITTYTAVFRNGPFSTQTMDVADIPALARNIRITRQPESCTVHVGRPATLSIEMEYSGIGEVHFLWEYYNNDTEQWEDAGRFSESYTDSELTIDNVTMQMNGCRFKCIITACDGETAESNETTITVLNKNGDVNRDGSVDVTDCSMIRHYAVGLAELDAVQKTLADVNGDGRINVIDVNYVRRYAARLIDRFPKD